MTFAAPPGIVRPGSPDRDTKSSPEVLPAPGRRRTASLALAALGLAGLVTLAFPRVVSGQRSFCHLDLFYEFTPIWHATQQALLHGEAPFWLPGQYCGHPLLFHQEVPLFYPLTPLLLLTGLPAHRLTDLFTLFHFWLAGVSAFLLVRDRTNGHTGASLFAAIGWMLSARTLQSSIWPSAVAAMALLPLCVLGILRLGRSESRASGVGYMALAGALSILTARFQSLWGSVPILLAIAVAVVLGSRERARTTAAFGLAAFLGLGLAAPTLLTSTALYSQTARAGGLSQPARDIGALSERHQLDQVFLPVDGLRRWPEAAAYPGFVTYLLLAVALVLAVRKSQGIDRLFLLALLAGGTLSLVFAFGEQGPYRLIADLPVARSFRVPARFLVGWSFLLVFGSSLAIPALELSLGREGLRATWLAVALLVGDLVVHAWRSAPTVSSTVYTAEPRIVRYLRQIPPDESGAPVRYLTLAPGLPLPAIADASRADAVTAMEPMAHARGLMYGLRGVSGGGPALKRIDTLLAAGTLRAAQLAGARLLVLPEPLPGLPAADGAPPGLNIHVVANPLPNAFVVPKAVEVAEEHSLEVALQGGFDPRNSVVVEEPAALPPGVEWPGRDGQARFVGRSGGRMDLLTRTPGPGILVVLESWEAGWVAQVDGETRPVLRTNGAFLGVPVGPGAHRVSLSYRPPLLREGLMLAVASALGLLLFALRVRAPRQAPSPP